MQLQKKQVAVVTGAASGIGLGLAHQFARHGLDVVLADVEDEALAAAAGSVRAYGGAVVAVQADVRKFDSVKAVADTAIETFGRVDIVCNNAGVNTSRAPLWELDENDWRWVLEVNLWGVINGIRAFVPHLARLNSGHIVNTASMAALTRWSGSGRTLSASMPLSHSPSACAPIWTGRRPTSARPPCVPCECGRGCVTPSGTGLDASTHLVSNLL